MKLSAVLISAFNFLLPPIQVQQIELLSKEDARAVFSMTRAQWIDNVQVSVATGNAKAIGTPATGLAMAMLKAEAHVIVKPDYSSNDKRPDFVQVTIGYLDPKISTILNGEVLTSAIGTAKTQLAPEFDVNASFEIIQNRLVIFFFIMQKER